MCLLRIQYILFKVLIQYYCCERKHFSSLFYFQPNKGKNTSGKHLFCIAPVKIDKIIKENHNKWIKQRKVKKKQEMKS